MDASTEDNRRGVLSAAQHARLRAQASGASHVRGPGTNLAQLVGKPPEGLEADLAEGRVVAADATLGLEPLPGLAQRGWVVRLDDGQTLALAPGVLLPPGRMRIYLLARSRWVVGGEPRPEQWEDYRSLVLEAQRLDRAQVDALRAGQLPPSRRAALRSRVRAWWIPALLWLPVLIAAGATGANVTSETLVLALLLGLAALWATLRIARVYRDTSEGKVTFVDGPIHINIVIGRQETNYRLVMGGDQFRLTGLDAGLVPVLHEGMPCRLYRTPTTGLFVAIEPLV